MEISKAKVSKYSLLNKKKYRDRDNLFMVQGLKAVVDTLEHFQLECLITKKGSPLCENSEWQGLPHYTASDSDLKKISSLEDLPEIIAIYKKPIIRADVKASKDSFSIVLDGVQDPGNLGTIIRTAHWFGIKKIFCSLDCADVYNPKVIQATMGSVAKVSVIYCDIEKLFLDNYDIPVYGLLLNGENIFNIDKFTPGLILMGNEGHGPKEVSLKYITHRLTIPPANPADAPDSLNVGIATAITLSQMLK